MPSINDKPPTTIGQLPRNAQPINWALEGLGGGGGGGGGGEIENT